MNFTNVAERADLIWQILREPPLHIRMWGGAEARGAFASCTRTRGRIPLLRKKTFGMAIMVLPENLEDPFPGRGFKNLRRRHRRAQQLGYTFASFQGPLEIDRVLAIHNSASERQGLPMASFYTDPTEVKRYLKTRQSLYGVFDAEGVLRAYCDWPVAGEAAMSARIIGTIPCFRTASCIS